MQDHHLADLLDMPMIQKLADSSFLASGLPLTIVDALNGAFLVKAGGAGICSRFHRVDPRSCERCLCSDRMVAEHLDEEAYQYRCLNGLWHIAMPITVAGRHLATVFLTQFRMEGEAVDRTYFIDQANRYDYELESYLSALDKMPIFPEEKLKYFIQYDKALVRFIADLAEQSLKAVEDREALRRAHDEMEQRVLERTRDLMEANRQLMVEIADRKRLEGKLRELSERDPLTGIFNRRKLFEILAIETEKSCRYGRPLSLLIFDLDHFKHVNDLFGHDAGDMVLKEVVQIVSSNIRIIDVFARYGGEEFVILCMETDRNGAIVLGEKIRESIDDSNILADCKVTISVGIATYSGGDGADLISLADRALFTAKRLGRNRVCSVAEESDTHSQSKGI
jgi:diguanylate cyclase (GGDEF)-like protein